MRVINVNQFIERELAMKNGDEVDRPTEVLEFRADERNTVYAILSHRWQQEVSYEEMIGLAKMERMKRDEIRNRNGYRKILKSCQQAKDDRHKWLWADTCCIDTRSSAELSEVINSMYRWYENSTVCYAYLHDVSHSSFPTENNIGEYSHNGWPEWFSRGWTLQEMIAASDVQFFNKNWKFIGDKKTLAHRLARITRVPERILTDGLSSIRPCVARIMSWAADRTTTRDEDRAYSLLGLLDVNMPMLYGEGKKAFHRLQLEIIRMSNDQSIFAWGCSRRDHRTGSILADDPSFFRDCHEMELMDHDKFIQSLKDDIPKKVLRSIEKDRFATFSITHRGIQIWLLLRPYNDSSSVFEARLPCRLTALDPPVAINLALWRSNYYRYFTLLQDEIPTVSTLQFCQLFLTYQDAPHHDVEFEIDDSSVIENGFIYCGAFPSTPTNPLMLTSTNPLCVKVYSDSQTNCRFAMGFGQCFGQDWVHILYEKPSSASNRHSWRNYAEEHYRKMIATGPDHAWSTAEERFRGERCGRVYITQIHLPRSTWTVRTSFAMWESSRKCGVKIEVFQGRGPLNLLGKWTSFNIDNRINDSDCDLKDLMLHCPWDNSYELALDGVSMKFSLAPNGIKLGDYGHFTLSKDFKCEGNIFADLEPASSVITPMQHRIFREAGYSTHDYMMAHKYEGSHLVNGESIILYKPSGLSLPNNHDVKTLLSSQSTRLTNRYIVTRVIQSPIDHSISGLDTNSSSVTTRLCLIAKPFVWHRDDETKDGPMILYQWRDLRQKIGRWGASHTIPSTTLKSSQVLRISHIELQNAGKIESAQLTISGSTYEVQKQQDSNILSAEFNTPLEVQEPFYLSLRKWRLDVLKWPRKKIIFDPCEVLSKLEDHQFRSKIQGDVTIVLDILPPIPPGQDTAIPHTPIPVSGSLTPTTDELLRQCPRFRILVIGKTGVGKSSLINSTFGINDGLHAHDKWGGINIETPLYSKSNDHFVLHDSKGFEAGEEYNLSNVKAFIERRKTHGDVKEQLHAVWLSFQIPLASFGQRMMEVGMEEFLQDKSEILRDIPTILVFTKYDILIEDIERRWILSRRNYSEEELDLEADQYLKRYCIQPIEDLTKQRNIPYIAVSSKRFYAGTLKGLTELTHQKVSEHFVQQHGMRPSPVPMVTAMAQRVVPWLIIEESINVGKRKYWKAVFAGADFSGYTIQDCLDVIHTDIVKVWNFYDPSGLLLCGNFRDFMMRMVTTLNENSTKALAHSNTFAMTELVAMLPIILPFAAGAVVIKWPHATYERMPEVQRKFMAYITDLTHVLDIIFTLTVSRSVEKLTIKIIKAAIVLYQMSQRRVDVHTKIKELPIAVFRGCDVNAEMESIVKSRYITDVDLKERVEEITPADLDGEEDWYSQFT